MIRILIYLGSAIFQTGDVFFGAYGIIDKIDNMMSENGDRNWGAIQKMASDYTIFA